MHIQRKLSALLPTKDNRTVGEMTGTNYNKETLKLFSCIWLGVTEPVIVHIMYERIDYALVYCYHAVLVYIYRVYRDFDLMI